MLSFLYHIEFISYLANRRSITIMSHVKEGICGVCIANEDGTASKASCEFEGSDEVCIFISLTVRHV